MARSARIGSFTVATLFVLATIGVALSGGYALSGDAMAAAPQELLTLNPVGDSTIDNSAKEQNFGTRSTLAVAWSGSGTRLEKRSVIRFDLARVGTGCQVVDKATLHLSRLATGDGSSANITAWRATETWAESTVNWYLQPGSTDPGALATVDDQAGDTTWDVTEVVQSWVDRAYGNYGFILIGTHTSAYARTFQSRESGAKPSLEIAYHSCFATATPTATATVVTATPTATASQTPNVSPTPTPTRGEAAQYDTGDAPDSTNHSADASMSAYPAGVLGRFPTVFRGAQPAGPLHWTPRGGAWLGEFVSLEYDADLGPDQDTASNLSPASGSADLDGEDDGLIQPAAIWERCEATTIRYHVTVPPGGKGRSYFANAWFDWDRDGAWGGSSECGATTAAEWGVQNQEIGPFAAPGTYEISSPAFVAWHAGAAPGPIWARLSIAEQPAGSDSGAGPAAGYETGETEDYYLLPAAATPTPNIDPSATWNLSAAAAGSWPPAVNDTASFTITVQNTGPSPLGTIALDASFDAACFDYLDADLRPNSVDDAQGALTWENLAGPPPSGFWSPLLPGQSYSFQVKLVATSDCQDTCVELQGQAVDVASYDAGMLRRSVCETISAETGRLRGDLGDAPDSAGVSEMRAYLDGTTAHFPTSHEGVAPYGPIHRDPRSAAWLGGWVTAENDAGLLPDEDTVSNLDPAANLPDRDGSDDGLVQPVDIWKSCEPTTVDYYVTVPPGAEGQVFAVNAWFDWDRSGDWGQDLACPGEQTASEWAVRNQSVGPWSASGRYLVTSPEFFAYHPSPSAAGGLWARLSLTTATVSQANGSGPAGGYDGGETEDYFLPQQGGGDPTPTPTPTPTVMPERVLHLPLVMKR